MYNFDKLFLAVLLCDSDSADVIFLDWPIFIIISYKLSIMRVIYKYFKTQSHELFLFVLIY